MKKVQSNLEISKLIGLFFTSLNYPKCKLIYTSGNLDLLKSLQHQNMVGESNQNVFLIQKASSFAEFEIFGLEIPRLDCTGCPKKNYTQFQYRINPNQINRSYPYFTKF